MTSLPVKAPSVEVQRVLDVLSEPPRILFVDDNQGDRDMFAALCAGFRCVVDLAATGKDGIELAATNDYVIVVLDAHLPDVPCPEVFRKIRVANMDRGKLCRIVVTSAVFNGVAMQILEEAGFIGFALKDRLLGKVFFAEMMTRVGVQRRA